MGVDRRTSEADGEGPADLSARGGPGTFRGTDFQLRFAVRQTLDAIERQALAPQTPIAITVERLLVDGRQSDKWDVVVEPPPIAYEAKVKPTAEDIRGWLTDAARAPAHRPMVLVFGERAGTTHRAAEQLADLARAAGDAGRFERYVADAPKAVRQVRELLGDDGYGVAIRLGFENVPTSLLDQDIERRARALAGDRADDLVSMLVDRFSAGAGRRVVQAVGDLIAEAGRRGISLRLPVAALERLPTAARETLIVLQAARGPVPVDVLARAVSAPGRPLLEQLDGVLADSVLVDAGGGRLVLGPLPVPIAVTDAAVAGRALAALLAWLDAHRHDPGVGDHDVDAALALSAEAFDRAPETVARSFQVLDKLLKRRGDKHLVLEAADQAIRAARAAEHSVDVVKSEAHALICGRSWALQRIGQVAKARADGEASLQIGKDIGWQRNTAFCNKCLGRLCRLEADDQREPRRTALLEQSIANLNLAIMQFSDLGLEDEVGDAYSLLARSLLSAGRIRDAEGAVAEAERRLTDPNDKDFLDLLIVRGDLLAAAGQPDKAIVLYDAVVECPVSDAERGEIRARALHARGAAYRVLGRRDDGRRDFVAAANAYSSLHEADWAAASELEALALEGRLPVRDTEPDVARLLEAEPPLVQVTAVKLHEAALAASAPLEGALAYRATPPLSHWRRQIDRARKIAAQQRERW